MAETTNPHLPTKAKNTAPMHRWEGSCSHARSCSPTKSIDPRELAASSALMERHCILPGSLHFSQVNLNTFTPGSGHSVVFLACSKGPNHRTSTCDGDYRVGTAINHEGAHLPETSGSAESNLGPFFPNCPYPWTPKQSVLFPLNLKGVSE